MPTISIDSDVLQHVVQCIPKDILIIYKALGVDLKDRQEFTKNAILQFLTYPLKASQYKELALAASNKKSQLIYLKSLQEKQNAKSK